MKHARKNQFIFTYNKINLKKICITQKIVYFTIIVSLNSSKKNEDYPFKGNPHSQLKQ